MKKAISLILILSLVLAVGCSKQVENKNTSSENPQKISAEDAKSMISEFPESIIVDVRTKDEYLEKHIPGAILLPLDSIEKEAETILVDKSGTYFVYCRSGSRSSSAAKILVNLGYENIYDLGGIIDWPYETVSGE